MSSRTITRSALISCQAIMLLLVFADAATAQADNASESAKQLTVQRIYNDRDRLSTAPFRRLVPVTG